MSLRALIFDIDGTLADTEEAHRHAFNGAFARAGLSWYWSEARYRDLLAVTGGKERLAAFVATLDLDAGDRERHLAARRPTTTPAWSPPAACRSGPASRAWWPTPAPRG